MHIQPHLAGCQHGRLSEAFNIPGNGTGWKILDESVSGEGTVYGWEDTLTGCWDRVRLHLGHSLGTISTRDNVAGPTVQLLFDGRV